MPSFSVVAGDWFPFCLETARTVRPWQSLSFGRGRGRGFGRFAGRGRREMLEEPELAGVTLWPAFFVARAVAGKKRNGEGR